MMVEPEIVDSPLAGTIERDGFTIRVEIYRGDDSDWILEVVDEYRNSVVWNDQFKTDQLAMDELLRTLDTDGIESLIDAPKTTSP